MLRADSALAQHTAVSTADLLAGPLIVMRSGYVMHRYLHRLLQGQPPAFSYSTDGAEMGKLMVAEGLGLTVLPDYSVIGDPLEQHGVITWRPLADDQTGVDLVIQRARSGSPPLAARDLHGIFVERAKAYTATHPAAAMLPGRDGPAASRPGRDGPGSPRRQAKARVRS
ncbi:MAG: LysR family transcriptional regulator substrate-binding protein [Streptosporangiaceae bacterium]